jgi:cation diffusion facilitator CzcD-associated flavoprotein CzcO
MFGELKYPDIDGRDSFEGVAMHTGRWDGSVDLAGKRVAVIGSAASAVQSVPEIAKVAGHLRVFQRSPNWVLPKQDVAHTPEQLDAFATDPQALLDHHNGIMAFVGPSIPFTNPEMNGIAEWVAACAIEVVEDPEVRRKLTPSTPWGCLRPLFSNDYYPTFNRENVTLVTDAIERITPTGIVTADGAEHQVDVIVFATGYHVDKFASRIPITGRDGVALADAWADGAQAYLGVTTSGFPNLFMLYGPNTNNGSIIYMIECQVDYVMQVLQRMDDERILAVDVKREVMDEYNAALQETLAGVEVWQAGCHGYYRVPSGRIVTQWPGSMSEYRARTEHPDPDAFEVVARATT